MRLAIVNAARHLPGALDAAALAAKPAFMSPGSITNSGDAVGHAASGTANRRDAACADDLTVLARGAGVISFALCVLALSAPTLWPRLFAH